MRKTKTFSGGGNSRRMRWLWVAGLIMVSAWGAAWAVGRTQWQDAAEYARFAKLAYQRDDAASQHAREALGNDWEEVPGFRTNNLLSGLKAVVFRNKNTGKVVVAFAGTDITDPRDWANNAWNHLSSAVPPPQYLEALELAARVTREFGEENVSVAGHSLGGGLATFVSRSLDLEGVTFNPDLQGPANQLWIDALTACDEDDIDMQPLTNYIHSDDAVRVGNQLHNVLGGEMGAFGEDVIMDYPVDGMVDAHDLDKMIANLERGPFGGGSSSGGGASGSWGDGGGPSTPGPGAGLPRPGSSSTRPTKTSRPSLGTFR